MNGLLNMIVLVVAFLMLFASVACAESPATVEVGEDSITVRSFWMSYTVPMEYVTIRGYDNIPTPTGQPPQTTLGPTAMPVPTPQPTTTLIPTPTPQPTPTTMEDLAITWFTEVGYEYEYDITQLEDAGVVNARTTYLREVGVVVAKFEAAGFSDYGVARCKVTDTDHWPQGWAMTLPEEHRPLSISDLDLAQTRYVLAEMERITPPPEIQPIHESDLSGLRQVVRGEADRWRKSSEWRDFWNTHGPDIDAGFDVCGWPGSTGEVTSITAFVA